jgi:phosphoribosyl-ATP pyrophosphohydrolase/phosphoribosyl-AMP cyclohydrolase
MEVILPESSFSWEDLNPSEQGLIPVVVQDYRNEEVLMVAYMNQEAYEATLRTGVMTYWSRSRRQLWVKGETSGHFQYLKELRVDCDNDTLLARVAQIGAACHTGNRSCFYRTALKKDTPQKNPMKVFEDVYATIEDRRQNPKEGSYTNYLFEKGIDKILKKCGEEAAEIIIAAKNPNPEEIKYEIADFLYHMMVLMSERGITWEDIAQELANRE